MPKFKASEISDILGKLLGMYQTSGLRDYFNTLEKDDIHSYSQQFRDNEPLQSLGLADMSADLVSDNPTIFGLSLIQYNNMKAAIDALPKTDFLSKNRLKNDLKKLKKELERFRSSKLSSISETTKSLLKLCTEMTHLDTRKDIRAQLDLIEGDAANPTAGKQLAQALDALEQGIGPDAPQKERYQVALIAKSCLANLEYIDQSDALLPMSETERSQFVIQRDDARSALSDVYEASHARIVQRVRNYVLEAKAEIEQLRQQEPTLENLQRIEQICDTVGNIASSNSMHIRPPEIYPGDNDFPKIYEEIKKIREENHERLEKVQEKNQGKAQFDTTRRRTPQGDGIGSHRRNRSTSPSSEVSSKALMSAHRQAHKRLEPNDSGEEPNKEKSSTVTKQSGIR